VTVQAKVKTYFCLFLIRLKIAGGARRFSVSNDDERASRARGGGRFFVEVEQ
jgi:hypothetical protein